MNTPAVPGTRPAACPDCGGPVPPGQERLCPNCGYPLMFLRRQPTNGPAVARAPGELGEPTAVYRRPTVEPGGAAPSHPLPSSPPPLWPSSSPPSPSQASEVACPRCAHRGPPTRTWCQRCGAALRRTYRLPRPAPPDGPLPTPPRPVPVVLLLTVAMLAVVTVTAGAYLLAT